MGRQAQQKIISSMFKALDPLESITLGTLVEKTGLPYATVKRYLKMIEYIQQQPKIEIKTTGHSFHLKLAGYMTNLEDESL